MQFKMFSITDTKAGIYHPPFFKQTPVEAQRDFQTLVQNEKTEMGKYPEDFDLFMVGTYDDQTGKIEPLAAPVHIVKALALKSRKPDLTEV